MHQKQMGYDYAIVRKYLSDPWLKLLSSHAAGVLHGIVMINRWISGLNNIDLPSGKLT